MSETVPVVLIVDVDPDTHSVTDGSMPETECALMSARTTEVALKMAERRPPTVLVVGDRMGGISYLSERLRRLTPHLHVILLASQELPHDTLFTPPDPASARQPLRAGGATSLIRKPFDSARFRSTLRTVLRLAAMAAGVKRMHGGTTESSTMARITPVPWVGSPRDSNPGRENK